MGRQYTKEEKLAAIKLYEKLGHVTWVMTELGYPESRTMLYNWLKKYSEEGENGLDKKSKYTESQRKNAVEYYLSHGMSIVKTITELGYPGKTLLFEWLNEDIPKEKLPKYCKLGQKVVKYSQEQKEEAVKQYCTGKKPKEIASELSVPPTAIRVWSKKLLTKEKIHSMSSKQSNHIEESVEDIKNDIQELESQRLKLEKEVYRLQLQKDILEKAGELLKKEKCINPENISNKEKAELIDALRPKYRLNELLKELCIAKSSYCYQRSAERRNDKYSDIRTRIQSIFSENYMSYGYRRIYGSLKRAGIILSEKVIRRIMHEDGLKVQIIEQKKYNSYKGEISPEVPNLLERNFHADKPNEKWLTDITEFRIPAGKAYLSPIIDCFDGTVVSWSIGTSPNAELVNSMLDQAISYLKPGEAPLVHSDRGCHYRWQGWIERMKNAGLVRSMSKKACSPDNSACEGFFGRLKNEMFYGRSWIGISLSDFANQIDTYIRWYNENRIKKSLNYLSPNEYRKAIGIG